MTTNPHLVALINAKRTYDDHVEAMNDKYGHGYDNEELTADELVDRLLTAVVYMECADNFFDYYKE